VGFINGQQPRVVHRQRGHGDFEDGVGLAIETACLDVDYDG